MPADLPPFLADAARETARRSLVLGLLGTAHALTRAAGLAGQLAARVAREAPEEPGPELELAPFLPVLSGLN